MFLTHIVNLSISSQHIPHDYGFRYKYSTQSAITFLSDSIRRNMDAGQSTGAIFIDFHKAFDTIDHKILLDKLLMTVNITG